VPNDCKACAPGLKGSVAGLVSKLSDNPLSGCVKCGPGKYQMFEGADACARPSEGHYSDEKGASEQKICERGTVSVCVFFFLDPQSKMLYC
jgi:hypothetical protein